MTTDYAIQASVKISSIPLMKTKRSLLLDEHNVRHSGLNFLELNFGTNERDSDWKAMGVVGQAAIFTEGPNLIVKYAIISVSFVSSFESILYICYISKRLLVRNYIRRYVARFELSEIWDFHLEVGTKIMAFGSSGICDLLGQAS